MSEQNQALPRQAREQLEEANRIEQEMAGAAEEAEVAEDTVEQTAQAAEEPEQIEAQPEPEQQEAAEEPTAEAQPDKWEEKYRTLQSKYDAEVPRLHQQNREMGDQMQGLQSQLEKLTEKLEAATAPPEEPAPALISEKDEENFGSDLIDLSRRVVREEIRDLSNTVKQLSDAIKPLQDQLGQVKTTSEATKADVFNSRLLELVPDWQAVNAEQEWLDWLQVVDPVSGQARQISLNIAHAQLNVDRVAAIFNAYKATKAEPEPTPKPTPKDDLSRQVSPSRQAGSASQQTIQTQGQAKYYSPAEIEDMLDPRKLRKLPPDRVAQIMSEIDLAATEGRILPQ